VPLHLAKIIHRDNLRVIEPGQGSRLALESLGELGITLLFRRQDLQRHQPIQPRLARLINRAHAAATEKANDLEVGEKLRHLGQGRRGGRRPFGDDRAVRPEFAGLDIGLHGQVQGHEAAGA
jgi:hypothetical protein